MASFINNNCNDASQLSCANGRPLGINLFALSFLLGDCVLMILPDLSMCKWIYVATVMLLVLNWLARVSRATARGVWIRPARVVLPLLLVICLGASYAIYQAGLHHRHLLPIDQPQQNITIVGIVDDVPQYKNSTVKFAFKIQQILTHNAENIYPGTIRLTWQGGKKLQLGQTWQLTVRLKRPHGFASPGCFDVEKYCFAKRIIATGYVVAKTKRLPNIVNKQIAGQARFAAITVAGCKLRQQLTDAILAALQHDQFAGIIVALVTGVQYKITSAEWSVVRDTGVAHLLAISGLHIGFVAAMAFAVAAFIWRCMPCRFLRCPAPIVGAAVAIISALGYGYLAGFSVSTQRACIMVVLAMLGVLLRRVTLTVDIFSFALLAVLVLDPFAVLTLSFWLSFTAVAILLYCFTGRIAINRFDKWIKPNLVSAVGMAPLLLVCFHTVTLMSPIANFIAIPWVSLVVVPLSLIGSLIYPIDPAIAAKLWHAASASLAVLWPILIKLQQLPLSNWQPQVHSGWILVLAFIGTLWLLAAKGFPGRIFGLCGFLPLLLPQVPQLLPGQVKFSLLDVGQGLAAVVATSNHVLVYDTGPKLGMLPDAADAGEQVLWPFLRANHIRKIDALVVSHADLDHSGGMLSLLQHILPEQILTPAPDQLLAAVSKGKPADGPAMLALAAASGRVIHCIAGQHWHWDGVDFTMLHPTPPLAIARNEQSCVLQITAPAASILLTGDIGHSSELAILGAYGGGLRSVPMASDNLPQWQQQVAENARPTALAADIMTVPHHGSKYSSAIEFIQAVRPKYALASVGYLNRYRHPHPGVEQAYQQQGAEFLATARTGTISFTLGLESKQLKANCYRIGQRRIWNTY